MANLPTLIEAARGLDLYDLARTATISIYPSDSGFLATFQGAGMNAESDGCDLPGGVDFSHFRAPDPITVPIQWQTSPWDQACELISSDLATPDAFGNMHLVEHKLAGRTSEADTHWIITTHGAAKSPERMAWIRSMETINAAH
jgi:hypothetical protein